MTVTSFPVRKALADLETKVASMGYRITTKGKADGSCEVTLTSLANGNSWSGIGSFRHSFPYETALKQAVARMEQYEQRFGN